MESSYEIVRTQDGSDTVRLLPEGVTFHSMHGAMQESQHVFITHGLANLPNDNNSISVFEMGFGTGLNAFLALQFAQEQKIELNYVAVDRDPLPSHIIHLLNYPDLAKVPIPWFVQLHSKAPESNHLSPYFTLEKTYIDIQDYHHKGTYDIVFFDAFGPGFQPFLWKADVLTPLFNSLTEGGILVTFCAQGAFKRQLKAIGFEVEVLPGPPGKREMTRARKPVLNSTINQ